jgi:L-asparaginase
MSSQLAGPTPPTRPVQPAPPARPVRVRVFLLGGTIGMTGEPGRGAAPALDAADLFTGLPVPPGVEVEAVDFLKVGSSHLGFESLLGLARAADAAVREGVEACVVVQGTDSMEETAYLLDLLWAHEAPLVVTGAMRNPSLPGPDGPANLVAALACAAAPSCRGLGALVVLNDEVHAARHVAKRHTSLPSAFVSPNAGPAGRMLEGVPMVTMRPPRRRPLPVPERVGVRVPLLTATLDDDPRLVGAVAGLADGLVVAGFGAGHLKAEVADAVAEVAAGLPVVLASRAGAGSVHTCTYAGPGSEEDLLGRGLVSAGHLDPLKARVLLVLLLAAGADRAEVARAFAEHGSVS